MGMVKPPQTKKERKADQGLWRELDWTQHQFSHLEQDETGDGVEWGENPRGEDSDFLRRARDMEMTPVEFRGYIDRIASSEIR